MAFTLGVGPVTASSAGPTLVLSLTGTTAGRSIVMGVRWNGIGSSIDTITCSGESNLTVHGTAVNEAAFTGAFLQNASLANNTTGGDKTITVSFSGSVGTLRGFALEVVGGSIASFFDANYNGTGSSPNPSITHTTGADNALIVATGIAYGGSSTAGVDYTLIGPLAGIDGEYDLDAGSAGAKTVDFVQAYNGAWAIQSTSFSLATNGAAFNLPVLTLSALGGVLGAAFNLPMLTLAAGNPSAIFNLPALTLSATGLTLVPTAFDLPMLTLVGVGSDSGVGISAFNLPALTFTGAGSTGDVGTAEFDIPKLSLSAFGVNKAIFNLPQFSLSGSAGQTGHIGTAVFQLPIFTFSTLGRQDGVGEGAFNIPRVQLSGIGVTGSKGTAVFNLPFPTLSAIGFTGVIGTAAFDFPVIMLSIAAHQSITGEAAFDLPVVVLKGFTAQGAMTLAAAYRTWVLNVRKGALTEYNNFSFNSFARFNGVVLACGPSGVFVLGTQDTDAGTAITGKYRTGLYGDDSAWVSRVPRAYLDGSQSGDLRFRVITTEGGTRTYNLQWNKITGHTQRRVPIGKGVKSRFFQYEVEGVDGANFSTTSLLTYPTKLRRRIAG